MASDKTVKYFLKKENATVKYYDTFLYCSPGGWKINFSLSSGNLSNKYNTQHTGRIFVSAGHSAARILFFCSSLKMTTSNCSAAVTDTGYFSFSVEYECDEDDGHSPEQPFSVNGEIILWIDYVYLSYIFPPELECSKDNDFPDLAFTYSTEQIPFPVDSDNTVANNGK